MGEEGSEREDDRLKATLQVCGGIWIHRSVGSIQGLEKLGRNWVGLGEAKFRVGPLHLAKSLCGSRKGEQPGRDSRSFLWRASVSLSPGPHHKPSGAQQTVQFLKLSKLGNSQPPTRVPNFF